MFGNIPGVEKATDLERTVSGRMLSAEDAELAKLGYKQEFKREFGWLATFSFAFSISGLLATVCWVMKMLISRLHQLGAFRWQLEDLRLQFGAGKDFLVAID